MQDVVVADLFMRIEMEPALPALALRARIPSKRQCLDAPVGKLDEILLQGIEAEGVFHLEGGELAVRAVGLDHELVAIAEEARVHAEIVEARIVEIAEHRVRGGMRHGMRVLRPVPELRFPAMA